jgi:predicted methyltransferase
MDCSQAVLTLFLLVPCDQSGGDSLDLAIAEALAAPERTATDRPSDPLRRPDRVLEFFEFGPGMRVLDLFSGGGYYSEILSRVVGAGGSVVAHNNQGYLAYVGDALAERYRDERLPNVEQIIVEADALAFPPASFDAALALLTWHDFYFSDPENGWPAVDRPALLDTLCAALKPGAVLGVSDHVAEAGSNPALSGERLHRIDPALLRSDIEGDCFEYEGELQVLRNPSDDHLSSVFDESVRGRSDRVVYRFRRRG